MSCPSPRRLAIVPPMNRELPIARYSRAFLMTAMLVLAGCDSIPSVPLPDFTESEPKGDPGVEVIGVEPGTEASRQGMKAGDVILEVNGDKVYNKEDLVTAFADVGIFFRFNRLVARRGDEEMKFAIRTNLDYSGIVTRTPSGVLVPRSVE